MSLQSTIGIAKTGTNSLRATIPEGIVAFLEVKEGEKLDWKMQVTREGERIAIVTKFDNDEKIKKLIKKHRGK